MKKYTATEVIVSDEGRTMVFAQAPAEQQEFYLCSEADAVIAELRDDAMKGATSHLAEVGRSSALRKALATLRARIKELEEELRKRTQHSVDYGAARVGDLARLGKMIEERWRIGFALPLDWRVDEPAVTRAWEASDCKQERDEIMARIIFAVGQHSDGTAGRAEDAVN